MKIDLHIHTTHSDGRNSPKQIIDLAKKGKLEVIAVADHDAISGVNETIYEGNKSGIKVIPAVEISIKYKNKPLHIIGYGIDINNKDLKLFLQKINDYRKKHYTKQIPCLNQNLKKAGKELVTAERYRGKKSNYYSIPGLALFLYEEGIVKERTEGFNYLQGILEVAPSVRPKDAFAIIHKAGGKAILSHPFAPLVSLKNISNNRKEHERILLEFKKQGLDGFECYQTGHSSQNIKFCLQLSQKYGFLISAGSDWHGTLEQVGKTIKKYIPNYLGRLGDLAVPQRMVRKILYDISN